MSFGTITIGSDTFYDRGDGTYPMTGLGFAAPTNEVRVRPALGKSKDGKRRASVSRVIEKDVTVPGGGIARKQLIVTRNITTTEDFTAAEIDAADASIDTFLTGSVIDSILQGKQ